MSKWREFLQSISLVLRIGQQYSQNAKLWKPLPSQVTINYFCENYVFCSKTRLRINITKHYKSDNFLIERHFVDARSLWLENAELNWHFIRRWWWAKYCYLGSITPTVSPDFFARTEEAFFGAQIWQKKLTILSFHFVSKCWLNWTSNFFAELFAWRTKFGETDPCQVLTVWLGP